MEAKKAAEVIEQIWNIQERLSAIKSDLSMIENWIADEVPDGD